MSKKNKLKKYALAKTMSNIKVVKIIDYEKQTPDSVFDRTFFKNPENETIIEIGCGRGEYTTELARKFPEKNFIGVDMKSDRLLHGAQTALKAGLFNVLFIRLNIECMDNFFPEEFFSEAWITFPDPYTGQLTGRKRLTNDRFLQIYRKITKKSAIIHLKTDDTGMYEFSMDRVEQNNAYLVKYTKDLYNSDFRTDDLLTSIQTNFEKKYLSKGKSIKYLSFKWS